MAEKETTSADTGALLEKVKGTGRKGLTLVPKVPKPKPVPKSGGYNFVDLMTTAWEGAGDWVATKDPGFGRSMKFTAPVAGKVLNRAIRKTPLLYWVLGPLAGGSKGSLADAGAMFGIPLLVGAMERDPTLIPSNLPRVKYLAKPAIAAMVEAAEKQAEEDAELAELAERYSKVTGGAANLDHLILVGLMGMPPNMATEILEAPDAAGIVGVLARYGVGVVPDPSPEPVGTPGTEGPPPRKRSPRKPKPKPEEDAA
jgi:hypothetical protein